MSSRCFLTLSLLLICAAFAGASDLHFIVYGVDYELGGTIGAGLYASEDGYLEPGFEIAGVITEVSGDTAVGTFEDLPPGKYVIAILHDTDGDNLMKTGAMGMPKEGYGFSGTGRPVTMPPKYNKVGINLDGSEDHSVDIFIKY